MTRFILLSTAFAAGLIACTDSDELQPDAQTCGDGVCSPDETHATCPLDCPGSASVCGDGACESDETTSSCPADCDTSLEIYNNSEWPVEDVFIWACGGSDLGPNQISSDIAIDGHFTIDDITPGCYNLGAANDGDTELWVISESDLTLSGGPWSWTLTTANAQAPD
jgi:hypothetical protein